MKPTGVIIVLVVTDKFRYYQHSFHLKKYILRMRWKENSEFNLPEVSNTILDSSCIIEIGEYNAT